MATFSMTSLGCAKNLVNSEQMAYLMTEAGFEPAANPDGADVAIVNTCGFIDAAKAEGIDVILEHARLKAEGKLGALIVTGCLAERYQDEIQQELPEIDAVLGVGSFGEIVQAAQAVLDNKNYRSFGDQSAPVEEIPRLVSTGPGWAWLRIAEGCNNFCAFCAIPFIRGRYRSRDENAIIEEAEALAEHGIKEVMVIAQDITRYGCDLGEGHSLAGLLRRLVQVEGIEWIRLHYLYPEKIDDELIDLIASEDKIVKYLDIPFQHINDGILRRMNRHTSGGEIRSLVKKLRERIPNLVLRTSLIAGLPGESDAEFEELLSFLEEAQIERAGVFPFSPEEGTAAASMEHVSEEIARERAARVEELQGRILEDFAERQVGRTLPVLIEEWDEDEQCFLGRSWADSPEVDSYVMVSGRNLIPGEIADVHITGADAGVLTGEATIC